MLAIDNVTNSELLKFLVSNENNFDVSATVHSEVSQSSERSHISALNPISSMFPAKIRPAMIQRKRNITPIIPIDEGLNDYESEDDMKTKETLQKVFPKDIGSFKVIGNNEKKCNGKKVDSIQDSSHLLSDSASLYEKFRADGYLYLKGLLNRDDIIAARDKVEGDLKRMGHISEDGKATRTKGWTVETKTGTVINGADDFANNLDPAELQKWKEFGRSPEIQSVVHSSHLRSVLTILSRGKTIIEGTASLPRSFDPNYTWMRIKAPNEFTTEHSDFFYFKKFTNMYLHPGCDLKFDSGGQIVENDVVEQSMDDESLHDNLACSVCKSTERDESILLCDECNKGYHMDTCMFPSVKKAPRSNWFCVECQDRHTLGTCWIPLDDVNVDRGVLALLPGSHQLPESDLSFKDSQIPNSYFNRKSLAQDLTWHTGAFQAGDVVFFDTKLVHCSSRNYEQSFRLSLDFRWYIAPVGRNNYLETNHSKFVHSTSRPFDSDESIVSSFLDSTEICVKDMKKRKLPSELTAPPKQKPTIKKNISSDQQLRLEIIKFADFLVENIIDIATCRESFEANVKSDFCFDDSQRLDI